MRDSQNASADSTRFEEAPGERPHHVGYAPVPDQAAEATVFLWGPMTRRPRSRFAVVGDEGVATVHEGTASTLTLERVLGFEVHTDPEDTGMTPGVDHDYDLVVFDGTGRARAIIRRSAAGDRMVMLDDVFGDDE